ncbi:TonB-dependent receptor [Sphingomonas xinjiangensis]|uniref:Iron complex outermembrane receptor protein n=1 Tax=Sphingomonas xinjiangensis TaxID=643568 RepID=A0A840YQA0_9SPHN|nr:TonB-dependent receptor [Sphingomonas xinjiangensis]MBB5710243.1 iron complex outermembrane receptor protein [Sphingomonas xinjiangensis]
MLRRLLLASVALIASPAFANEVPARTDADAPVVPAAAAPAGQDHQQPTQEVVVTGSRPRATADVLGGVTVLSGQELTRQLRPTIGETLARQPGVSATSFGPNASRPVLRGFVGARAPLLIDGIGSIDVSNTSADHAPVINPLTADRIEVLRGPTALIFGPSAVGGVVNVIDSRIPRHMPEEAVHADGIASYGSAADERSVSAAIDLPAAGKIVLHADGSYTKTNDQNTGGYVLSRDLRRQAAASAEPEIQELADLKGTVPNTAAETWEVAGGAAIVDDRGNLGFSVSHFDSLYGVPVRYSLDPAVEAENVRLHVKQDRFDLRGEVDTGDGFLRQIRLRAAIADYQHQEIEDTGEVGTTFYNQGLEGRLELVQRATDRWDGLIGGQFSIRNLHVVGEEKFLPRNEAQQFGAFTLQSLDFGALKAEGALRYEHNQLTAQADADIGNPAYRRSFDTLSGSLGASYALAPGIRLGLNGSRSERAPTPEELFANGPHAGTQAFEIGNPDFTTEKAWGLEATLKGSGDGWSFSTAAYYNWFSDYIFDTPTGETEDDLPVFQYVQADARYYGFEAEGSVRLGQIGGFRVNADALADYVHAEVVDSGPVPRIPPLRVMGGLEAQSDLFNARIEVERNFKQDRVAAFETETNGFTLVNASVAWKPWGAASNTSLLLSANNLFDVEARRHTSVLKDYAPLAGRDLRATLRVQI